jgi:ABC-2 type transport system permease protein
MIRTFAFVTFRSFLNRLVHRLKRLRKPRYALSLVAGLVWFWFTAGRHMLRGRSVNASTIVTGDFAGDAIALVAFAALLLAWALPGQSGGIELSEAEIAFLFPAPLSRRQLLLYKLVRMQPQILISATIMSLLGLRRGLFVGVWLMMTTLSLYFLTVALARARLRQAGIGFAIRLPVVLAAATLFAWQVFRDFHDGPAARMTANALRWWENPALPPSPFDAPLTRVALFVPRALVSLAFPASLSALAISIVIIAIFAAALFLLAARLNVSFEDASIALAQKKADRALRRRHEGPGRAITFRRFPPLFQLRGTHSAEVAILWKNLIATMRIASPWIFLFVVPTVALVATAFLVTAPGVSATCALMLMTLAALFPFVGTLLFAQDLRLDLPRIEILKSYPISGERLLMAEMAAPLVVLTALEMMLLTAMNVVMRHAGDKRFDLLASAEFIVIALLFAIPICGTQLLIHNAAPVLLPGWAIRSKEDVRGFAASGQRMVLFLGNVLVLSVALAPAALLFLPAWWISHRYFGRSPGGLAILISPSVALLAFEVWLGTKLLGSQLDRIDVANEIDTMGV